MGLTRGFGGRIGEREAGANATNADRTIEKWNHSDSAYSKEGFKCYWELLEEVQHYQAFMMANGKDIIQYLACFFPEGKKMEDLQGLVIGCMYGEHTPANSLARTGAFRKLSVVDIADGLLKRQKELTDRLGLEGIIEYNRRDLNVEAVGEANSYDFILGIGTIHHIERLEGLFSEINSALREDGIFCMREYVGPCRLQFTDKQINICDRILKGLPDYLKRDKDGVIKAEVSRPSVDSVVAEDPSEAVRSEDIMETANRSLEVLACNWTGGTLLHPLLAGIAGNFERGDAERAILKGLIVLERVLIEEGVISSDYVFFVGRSI